MNDFDDIDRALFALPLETPPADLRERILAATVRAPASVTAPLMRPLDIGLLCLFVVLLVGSCVATIVAPGPVLDASAAVARSFAPLGNPALWMWLGLGGSIAGWLLFIDVFPSRPRLRAGS